jgi:hypothetical protein
LIVFGAPEKNCLFGALAGDTTALSKNGAAHDALMRVVLVCLLCLAAGACSTFSELPHPEVGPQPGQEQLTKGIVTGITDSNFAKPVEITELLRSPSSYEEQWMICIRSASSAEARRLTYSVLYGTDISSGQTGQYVKSRYSVFADNCDAQTYHSYSGPLTLPSASPSPSPTPEPKKHHSHLQ